MCGVQCSTYPRPALNGTHLPRSAGKGTEAGAGGCCSTGPPNFTKTESRQPIESLRADVLSAALQPGKAKNAEDG